MRSDVPAVTVAETVPAAAPAAKVTKPAKAKPVKADGLGVMRPAAKPVNLAKVSAKLGKMAGLAKAAKPAKAKPAAKAAPEKKPAKAAPLSKRAQVAADAAAGKLPTAPDFSAPTHARYVKKLAEIVALVKAGDIKGLKANDVQPLSSSRAALCKYRDFAIVALEARAKAGKAKAK